MTDNYNKKILIVDDEIAIANNLKKFFELSKYEASYILDGKEALDYCKNNSVDAIILDMMLPSMTGRQILEEYKNIYKDKKAPYTILLTGNFLNDTEKNEFKELGANEVLMKPIKSRALVDLVSQGISKK